MTDTKKIIPINDANEVIPWYFQGWAIVAGLLLFWPVGLVQVLGRLKTDRSFYGAGGRLLRIAGWVLVVLFSLALFSAIASLSVGRIFSCTVFDAGGLALIWQGSRMEKTSARRRMLIRYIVNEQTSSLDTIASQARLPVNEVLDDVQRMMAIGFLPGFELDPVTRCISRPPPAAVLRPGAQTIAMTTFTCSGCGARNQVTARQGHIVCEFCELPAMVA